MICYYYPPLSDVGCKRSVAFSKYWKKAGWKPHVLSVKNPDKTYCSLGDDRPPENIPVTYTYSLFNIYKFFGKVNGLVSRFFALIGVKLQHNYFYDVFCIPDLFIGWLLPAIVSGLKIIRRERIDIIYVSCSPFSAGIIGWCLKKITGKTLVIDYRDPYGLDISRYQQAFKQVWFRKPINRWIAGTILKSCDLFTVTSEETKELYVEQFPGLRNKIHTVYNGFDHHLFDNIKEQIKFPKFTIIYTGNFYYDIEFNYFFEGLGILKQNGKINSDNFQFLFYGGDIEYIKDALIRYNIVELVHVKSRIPYTEILKEIKRSHLQLLRITQPMISTKLFEGIALNIPLLATVPVGEVEKIVREYSHSSYVVSDNSAISISHCILSAMSMHENAFKSNEISSFLDSFSREKLSLEMIKLFVSLSGHQEIAQ